jgi:adenylosuccinate lyase
MDFPALDAISPVDGRYRRQCAMLASFFSEASIIRYRIKTEVEYFIALCEIPLPQLERFDSSLFPKLRSFYLEFRNEYATEVKDIEKETNHDIKAIEYFLRRRFDEMGVGEYKEFIHFGLTSQDVNNTAFPMAIRDAMTQIIVPVIHDVMGHFVAFAREWKDVPMLAHTHGQPASPTLLGKEFYVFAERLQTQLKSLAAIPFTAKFGGATGNLNAHYVAYPDIDWHGFANRFVSAYLGLERQRTTTQIEHYDQLAALFDAMKRINNILIDFDRDIWTYISMEYFRQKVVGREVGSSAMPHKVNPIDFENSEGNLGLANALFEFFAAKLPVSRLQRDLTDSTVIRNFGVPLAHSLIAYLSLMKGMGKLLINKERLTQDLWDNQAVIAEAIQTILRRESYPDPYGALKALTRGEGHISKETFLQFIESLDVTESVKAELKILSPENYTGRFILPE